VSTASREDITRMLKAWSDGNREMANDFMPLVYEELRRQASRHLRRERSHHTLQTTALVHEAYLRLIEQQRVNWQNRAHFFALASNMMRRILVNYALNRNRLKRGGPEEIASLDESFSIAGENQDLLELLALDRALTRLAELDEQQARIIELRYFSGLSIEETAEVLAISTATVKRDWNMARAFLRAELISGENK
jgi:RNA polymerase sigma factor (TIGR02999 family)